jgi:hypothetical protein
MWQRDNGGDAVQKSAYIKRSSWLGSKYELAMEFYPAGDDTRLLAALHDLWSDGNLAGPLESPYNYPEEELTLLSVPAPDEPALQAITAVPLPDRFGPGDPDHLFGLMTIPSYPAIGIECFTVREEQGSDWLYLGIPTGMLEHIVSVDYSLSHEKNPWMDDVDEHFLRLADSVYAAAPFDLAIVGDQVDLAYIRQQVAGHQRADTFSAVGLDEGGILVPPTQAQRFRSRTAPRVLPSGVHWFPPNEGDSLG